MEKRMLVVSSHALDYVWRAGGTIAAYAKMGWQIRIICLTYGERGESDSLWEKNPGITEEEVKKVRHEESTAAAAALGASVEFWDLGDHLLELGKEEVYRLAKIMKEFRPSIILTQYKEDTCNSDHPETLNAVLKAVRCARVSGVFPELKKLPFPSVFMYDPSQPEFFGFKPDVYIDITDVIDDKVKAMSYAGAQQYLIENYNVRAIYRGMNAKMFTGDNKIKYAEAFVRFRPYVGKEFC